MKKIILTVESKLAGRPGVGAALRSVGHEVIECTSSAIAWELFRLLLVDLVISEVALPQLDGIEFTRQVRTLPLFQNVPILLLSDALDRDTIEQGWMAGASGWLERPFGDDQLLSLAAEMLAGRTGFAEVVPVWRPLRKERPAGARTDFSVKRSVG